MTEKLIIAAVILLTGFVSGVKVEGWKRDSRDKARMEQEQALREKDLERVDAVSTAYERMTAEMRRIQTGIRTEVYRETQRVEYRCPVPDSGRVLINQAVDAANRDPGKPEPTVPTAPADNSKGPG